MKRTIKKIIGYVIIYQIITWCLFCVGFCFLHNEKGFSVFSLIGFAELVSTIICIIIGLFVLAIKLID